MQEWIEQPSTLGSFRRTRRGTIGISKTMTETPGLVPTLAKIGYARKLLECNGIPESRF